MEGFTWMPYSRGFQFPNHAVPGGTDVDGATIYVGRAYHEGDLIPAKVIPCKSAIYVSYGGQEISKDYCEVLVQARLQWITCYFGEVPPHAISAGYTNCGEKLYVGRVNHNGSITIGKVHSSHRCCYIPFGGSEYSYTQYEVLVYEF